MHLKVQKRNGREYLSVVQNYRQDGKTRTQTVETIGYADAYADQFDDPIAHFRAHVDELNARAAAQEQPIELAFDPDAEIDPLNSPRARLGAAIALGCLDAIGVHGFFQARAGREGFPQHAGRAFEMFAAERMMHATSKRESWTNRAAFPRKCDFSLEDAYAALPCLARESRHLEAHLRRSCERIVGPADTRTAFLVCGTYNFPIGGRNVCASIAVALDGRNLPIAYREWSGPLSVRRIRATVDDVKGQLGSKRVVVIAGALKNVTPAMEELAATGDGFVLFQPDIDESPSLRPWVENGKGYRPIGDDARMKTRVTTRELAGEPLPVREVALRGGGYALRNGHAVLATSETNLTAAETVQLFRELWRQAEPFQPLEADFSPTPFPVADRDHIRAHFAICYAAFTALRILRWKAGWAHNAADTADALLRMEGVGLQRNYYLFSYRSDVTDAIERAAQIAPARRLRTQAELRSVPAAVRRAFENPLALSQASRRLR